MSTVYLPTINTLIRNISCSDCGKNKSAQFTKRNHRMSSLSLNWLKNPFQNVDKLTAKLTAELSLAKETKSDESLLKF